MGNMFFDAFECLNMFYEPPRPPPKGHNMGIFGQNMGIFGQNMGILGQNMGILGHNVSIIWVFWGARSMFRHPNTSICHV